MFHLSLFIVFFLLLEGFPMVAFSSPPLPAPSAPSHLAPNAHSHLPCPHFQPLSMASYGGGPAVGCVSVDRVLVFFLDTVVNLEEAVIPV